ncbi:hypothetical protein FBU30_010124 [Linnemannia zychae]|nr:hypothetical protein FBU30_010124 [Linnemannia zychae]
MRVKYHLVHQPKQVETFIIPSINTTVQRIREKIAEAYRVDLNAFDMLYRNNKLDNAKTLNTSGFGDNNTIVVVPTSFDKHSELNKSTMISVKAAPSRRSGISRPVSRQKDPYSQNRKLPRAKSGPSASILLPESSSQQNPQDPPIQSTTPTTSLKSLRLDMRFVGPIPGVPVGTFWEKRIDVSRAKVHRPSMAGISGAAEVGAESVVLSGGYSDDDDKGDEFIYTGAGGNKDGKQIRHQELTRANHGLAYTCNCPVNSVIGGSANDWHKSRPIRVVRGAQLKNHYAPRAGYRYDGIYKVVKYWPEVGKAGFRIWRYLLRRDDPEPAPWKNQSIGCNLQKNPNPKTSVDRSSRLKTVKETASTIRNASEYNKNALGSFKNILDGNDGSFSLYNMTSVSSINQGSINENNRHGQNRYITKKEVLTAKMEVDGTRQIEHSSGEHSENNDIPKTVLSDDDDTVVGETTEPRVAVEQGESVEAKKQEAHGVNNSWLQSERSTKELLEDWT